MTDVSSDNMDTHDINEMSSKFANLDVDLPDSYYRSLPDRMKKRVKALKNLQVDILKKEAAMAIEVHAIELKYEKMLQPTYEKRKAIVNGSYEPSNDECDFPSDHEDSEDEVKVDDFPPGIDESTKGIPLFWSTVLSNVDITNENIQDDDKELIKSLTDIRVEQGVNPMSFTLFFHFGPNDYILDEVLTKKYVLKCEVDPEFPMSFEGPEINSCEGCTIHWKEGKDLTKKIIQKKQKHKTKGTSRIVNKEVQADSFFNFFNPPKPVPEDDDEHDEIEELLVADFEIGETIRTNVIQRAVLLFTGEFVAEDDEDFESDDDEEEETEESDEEPPPQELSPPKSAKRLQKKH